MHGRVSPMIQYPTETEIAETFILASSIGSKKEVRQALMAMPDELLRIGITTVETEKGLLLSPTTAQWVRDHRSPA